VTAGAGLTIAKFLRVDYAFESHPVLSPVHRVSISVSPYLFAHAPKPEPAVKARPANGLLGAEPEEPVEPDYPSDTASAVVEPGELQPQEPAPQTPTVQETDADSPDEVLETAPSGGTYWEE